MQANTNSASYSGQAAASPLALARRNGRRLAGFALASLIGLAAGVGAYTFVYAEGASYMTNDPRACANCHVMNDHLAAWSKSGHHHVASCNDCHAPHDFIGKYLTKARNGFNHSLAFTTGRFHEPIQITPKNRAIAEGACRHCHQELIETVDRAAHAGGELACTRCHVGVGHAN